MVGRIYFYFIAGAQGVRTSLTHSLRIAELKVGPGMGLLGITFAPGKHQKNAASGSWLRDLATDLDAIAAWNARAVVTLLEKHEIIELNIPNLGDEVVRRKMEWFHLPIRDYGVPGLDFEISWPAQSESLRAIVESGENILVHCKGGLGRAGMIGARLLVELGVEPGIAIRKVRSARPGAIETPEQENLARNGRGL
jgi:Cyclin-dependent kinase inhibitor 3 (CDKN3)